MNPIHARSLFPLTKSCIFMDHAGTAPMSDRARAALAGLADQLASRPAPDQLAEEAAARLRSSLARLLGAPARAVLLGRSSVHQFLALLRGLDLKSGENVVGALTDPPWPALEGRGVELRQVEADRGRLHPEVVLARVDSRTRMVALDHVQPGSGCRLDLEAIGRECRRRGVVFALEGSQSVGAINLDLAALPVDFLAADASKWLLGPVGAGFCYVHPLLQERLSPGWLELDGSHPSILDAVAFGVAVDLLLEVGPGVIEERVLSLAGNLATGLAERGYQLLEPWPRPRAEASGIVSFRRPGSNFYAVLRELQAASIAGDARADFVRLSPHFYNTDDEVTQVLDVLAPQTASLSV